MYKPRVNQVKKSFLPQAQCLEVCKYYRNLIPKFPLLIEFYLLLLFKQEPFVDASGRTQFFSMTHKGQNTKQEFPDSLCFLNLKEHGDLNLISYSSK